MYGTAIIKLKSRKAQFKTSQYYGIYDFLIDYGYSHDIAANVADWAELASVGEEYELGEGIITISD